MGICGTGMASLAGLLQEKRFTVCGSDTQTYPPMSEELAKRHIPVFTPYGAENLKKQKPDLVIVGNVISKDNPEAQYLLDAKIPYVSMPQALNHFFLKDKDVIVVAGTHGKTTTTALLTYLLKNSNADPSFLIGGVSQDFAKSFHIGLGNLFVIEGDEYDTAFFDKGPKFLHYNPKHVIMTSLEFDHADIYENLDQITQSFTSLAKIIPPQGSLHYDKAYAEFKKVVPESQSSKTSYGFKNSDWQIQNFKATQNGSEFDLVSPPRILKITSPLSGKHNALNVAGCFSVMAKLGFPLDKAIGSLKNFQGIKRRQEILYQDKNLIVIDDFAHHPTAVKETIAAVKSRFPKHELIAIFEPRSNTTIMDIFQQDYTRSFESADEILLAPVFKPEKIKKDRILNIAEIATALQKQGKRAKACGSTQEIIDAVVVKSQKPCTALIMSNGGFENIHNRLIKSWKDFVK